MQISNDKLDLRSAKMKTAWAKMAITTPYLHETKTFLHLELNLYPHPFVYILKKTFDLRSN
jgi:hypothetical protein